ncbi:DNA adenine methylase [Pseudobutyrivibrio ruminis]|uniref:Site-specific DNA-methyltransferase (adenine-specific) n=1 Tax=Pseudobutyrivibrio ruminis TaxID=46206 RepID=A0A1H7EXV0_9FIRM|nr:DNA adenine methylase [Pseudobutyrivibrio ruminis]SEK18691.1 DNA adenine methylase [Pseudobutyrivibrio ruminis]
MDTIPKPVLKWAGGKRQIIQELKKALPEEGYNRYIEPFIGGGAFLFELQPEKAIINDYNGELTNLYKIIRDDADSLIKLLDLYKSKHCKEFYYEVRAMDRMDDYDKLSDVEKAARTVYLNRTCYNGLFRVNSKGYFNTPIGRYKNPQICDRENLLAIQSYLKKNKVKINTGDFEKTALLAKAGDFVYLDPPYYPLSPTSSFTDYTSAGFGEAEQIRLKKLCDKLTQKGVLFLQSNSDCDYIRNLYDGYSIKEVEVRRSINSKKDKRDNIKEVLIANYSIV